MTRLSTTALVASMLASACAREDRHFDPGASEYALRGPVASSPLRPAATDAVVTEAAGPTALADGDRAAASAWATGEGQRLYTWYNCSGCHANGGGGMGPALMDAAWRYGSDPATVYRTITAGRPNGMPAFRGRIPDHQVWQLVAYVRSLSGLLRRDVEPSRSDTMAMKVPESMRPTLHPYRGAPAPGMQP